MRRPAAFLIGTILGSALLAGARLGTHPIGTETVLTGPPGDPAPADGAGPGGTGPGGAAVTAAPSASPGSGSTRPAPTAAPPNPSGTGGASTDPPAGGGAGLTSGTFAGVPVTHKYGTLRLTITVGGGRITQIVESYQTSLRVSAKINADAIPRLRQEALTAQSADIDTVSGATYTSDAYRMSLQSALDKAKA